MRPTLEEFILYLLEENSEPEAEYLASKKTNALKLEAIKLYLNQILKTNVIDKVRRRFDTAFDEFLETIPVTTALTDERKAALIFFNQISAPMNVFLSTLKTHSTNIVELKEQDADEQDEITERDLYPGKWRELKLPAALFTIILFCLSIVTMHYSVKALGILEKDHKDRDMLEIAVGILIFLLSVVLYGFIGSKLDRKVQQRVYIKIQKKLLAKSAQRIIKRNIPLLNAVMGDTNLTEILLTSVNLSGVLRLLAIDNRAPEDLIKLIIKYAVSTHQQEIYKDLYENIVGNVDQINKQLSEAIVSTGQDGPSLLFNSGLGNDNALEIEIMPANDEEDENDGKDDEKYDLPIVSTKHKSTMRYAKPYKEDAKTLLLRFDD